MRINRTMKDDLLVLTNPETGEQVEIRETIEGGEAVITPSGRLTTEMTHDLEDELTAMALSCRRIEIRMQEVAYISNSVIRMILQVQHMVDARSGEMFLQELPPQIYAVFEDMGLDGILDIRTS